MGSPAKPVGDPFIFWEILGMKQTKNGENVGEVGLDGGPEGAGVDRTRIICYINFCNIYVIFL